MDILNTEEEDVYEAEYWTNRLAKQASTDLVFYGRIGTGNMDAILSMAPEQQSETLGLALNYAAQLQQVQSTLQLEVDEKLKIVAQAEKLAEESDINIAFKELQNLHKIWKEDIGPVSKGMREDVWQKFSAATKKIHDRRHDHFREMRSKYQEIIENKLIVRITDNGNGIKKEHFERLFERFYRIDNSGNRTTGGSGLGLAIVKHIIDAHNEKIYVESDFGIGSEFSFSLEKSN